MLEDEGGDLGIKRTLPRLYPANTTNSSEIEFDDKNCPMND
jgi:hypothetical protein